MKNSKVLPKHLSCPKPQQKFNCPFCNEYIILPKAPKISRIDIFDYKYEGGLHLCCSFCNSEFIYCVDDPNYDIILDQGEKYFELYLLFNTVYRYKKFIIGAEYLHPFGKSYFYIQVEDKNDRLFTSSRPLPYPISKQQLISKIDKYILFS